MDFFDFLKDATKADLIQWKPTGEEFETRYLGIEKGYETTVDGYSIKTVVRARPKGFFKQGWGKGEVAHGIIVEKDGKTSTFTDDPKTIPGQESSGVHGVCYEIQKWSEKRDLITSLTGSLALLLYS